MDEAGWHARKRADEYYNHHPAQNPDGTSQPRVSAYPFNAPFIGGFPSQPPGAPSTVAGQPPGGYAPPPGPPPGFPQPPATGQPPPPPPKTEHALPDYHPAPWQPDGNYRTHAVHPNPSGPSAAERANTYLPMAKMDPHLQFLCGPLLKYDTVVNNVWQGACMVVTADAGSVYQPHPTLTLEWDPQRPVQVRTPSGHQRQYTLSVSGVKPGDHPTDTYGGVVPPTSPPVRSTSSWLGSEHSKTVDIEAQEIWVYHGPAGSCTFWRWLLRIPLAPNEMGVRYRINRGQDLEFFVPGIGKNMRWVAYSCNGFSSGVNQEDFKGPGHASGFDPVWTDLMQRHNDKPFHALIGGGDQLYSDALMREPELQEYVNLKSGKEKIAYPIPETVRLAVDRFYFSHYCLSFRNGFFAKANSSIPMVNMLDDHDIIDGFGSYPADLQLSPMFQLIGTRGYFYFLLFQHFMVDALDGINPNPGRHNNASLVIGGPGAWIPFPSHSFLTYLGPNTYMLLLDGRAERKIDQVCSEETYKRIFEKFWQLPDGVEHLILQLGIPIAYPRMNFMETALESSFNPLVALGRANKLGLQNTFVNKFNKDAELLDDLNDHWTSKGHKKERNWLVEQLQNIALQKKLRISFLSGDVHCAAVGYFKTLATGNNEIDPKVDWRYMLNIVSSAIVNTPPPPAVQQMVSLLSDKRHKTMHHVQTDESMIPIFQNDTNGTPLKNKNILGRRNYCIVEYDSTTHGLIFDIRVEKEKGVGTTVSYPVTAPAPLWNKH